MADKKTAALEGGLVTTAAHPGSGASSAAAAGSPATSPRAAGVAVAVAAATAAIPDDAAGDVDDADLYEIDARGDIMLDATGNPVRLAPAVDPVPLYRKLVASAPITVGKSKSRKERIAKDLSSPNLAYSEVTLELMQGVFAELRRMGDVLKRKAGIFVDLGSGMGKAVFAAAMLHEFHMCVGVEVLKSLHDGALELLEIYDSRLKGQLRHAPKIELVLGDMVEFPWQKAHVVFINMTTFTEQLIDAVRDLAQGMKRGAVCITVTKQLRSKAWELVHVSEQELSWGSSQVYIHRKVL
jgi:hypothetical protein